MPSSLHPEIGSSRAPGPKPRPDDRTILHIDTDTPKQEPATPYQVLQPTHFVWCVLVLALLAGTSTPTAASLADSRTMMAQSASANHPANLAGATLWNRLVDGIIPAAIIIPTALAIVLGIAIRRCLMQRNQLALKPTRISHIPESLPAGLLVLDAHARIVETNPEAERTLGLKGDQLLGCSISDIGMTLTDSEGKPWQGDPPCQHTLRTGKPLTGLIAGISTTRGRQCWVSINTRPITGEQGQITGVVIGFVDITQAVQARDAAIAAQARAESMAADLHRLALVAKRTTNAVIIIDANRKIVWVNEGFTGITGYTLDEVAGFTPGAFLQFEDTSRETIDRMRKALHAGLPFQGEIVSLGKLGQERWFDVDIQPLHDEQGSLTGFLAVQSDITDQVEQRKAIAEREQRFRTLVNNIPGVSYRRRHDEQWTVEFISEAIQSLTGYTPEDFIQRDRSMIDILHPKDLPGIIEAISTALEQGQPYTIEYRMLHRDGSVRWVTETGRGVASDAGAAAPLYLDGAIFDITPQKEAAAAYRNATAYLDIYRKIVDLHAIVAETDQRGTITSVNDAFCQISGYQRHELIGRNHRIINSGFHPKSMWTEMFRTLTSGQVWHGEICNRTKNGQLYWVDSTIAPLYDETGAIRGYFAIRADITALKRAQAHAETANEAKSQFLANMSHEIRTPLTAILGYAEIIRDDFRRESAPTARTEAITTIQRAGEHLLTVINDILDISKIEAGELTVEGVPTQITRVLSDVHRLMKARARGKDIQLNTSIATPIPASINSDPTKLRQILMNLVGNAIKFTERGSITITVSAISMAGCDTLRFDIEDTGPGLTPEQAESLFTPFFQADSSHKRRHGGTGLGLTISQRLARLMQGDVWLERTEPGKGSCFSLILPIITTESAGRIEPIQHLDSSIGNDDSAQPVHRASRQPLDGRILLAEDGLDNQQLIAFHLRKAGATVEIADNGRIALDMLANAANDGRPYDLLLTDIQMPEMDGFTLTRTLREQANDIPIIAITAHAMAEDRQRCLDAGCNDYSSKPIDQTTLIAQCRKWMLRRTGQNTQAA